METHRGHPLYYLDAETLLVATCVWVDDELKALQAQGVRLPRPQKGQKATLPGLLTLAIYIILAGQDLAKGCLTAKTTLRPFFPSLLHLFRFYRILRNAQALLARLAQRLAQGQGLIQVVDLKPIPHRIHDHSLPQSAGGGGPPGGFGRLRPSRECAGDLGG